MATEKLFNITEEQERYNELLLSFAADFQNIYFEKWREELASQRSSLLSQLLKTRITKLERENCDIQIVVKHLGEQVSLQNAVMKALVTKIEQLHEQLHELTDIVGGLAPGSISPVPQEPQ